MNSSQKKYLNDLLTNGANDTSLNPSKKTSQLTVGSTFNHMSGTSEATTKAQTQVLKIKLDSIRSNPL